MESKLKDIKLSSEASFLLKEASQDPHGTILYIRHLSGTLLETNGKSLIPSGERREIAKWEKALEDLVQNNLITARGNKGEVFEITALGYETADAH